MPLSFASRNRTGRPKSPAPRRATALVGVFAILLQAALFAWHHHSLPLSPRGGPTVLAAAGHGGPELLDDDCPICFALSHHSAARVDLPTAPMPSPVALPGGAIETVWAAAPSYLLFRSRAPPRA